MSRLCITCKKPTMRITEPEGYDIPSCSPACDIHALAKLDESLAVAHFSSLAGYVAQPNKKRTLEVEILANYRAGDQELYQLSKLHEVCLAPFLDAAAKELVTELVWRCICANKHCVWNQVQLRAWRLRWAWEATRDHDSGDEDRS